MRIGIFSDTYPPYINGVSTSVSMLKTALEKMGHQVYVVTVNNSSTKYKFEDNKKVIRIPGIPTGIYDYRLTGIYPIRAINIIKKWKLDIIHTHTEFGIGSFGRIFAKQFDIPLVHTYHTMYEDYIHYITKGFFEKSSKKIVEYLTNFYCDRTLDELIVPTKKTYDLFIEKYGYTRLVHIVPTGIEVDRFYLENVSKKKLRDLQKNFNFKKDDFVITFVGRIAEEKNVSFLLKAHKKIVKKAANIKLLIIGDGPDLAKYQEEVKKAGLEDKIIFTGRVPWEEIPVYYQLSSIFTTASTTETQGLTVIEAMAGAVPPLCINDESFNTTVVSGLNGYLFETEKEYIDKVLELSNNPDLLKKLSTQARVSAEQHSSKYYGERVYDVYQQAIRNQKKSFKEKLMNKIKGDKDEEDTSSESEDLFK